MTTHQRSKFTVAIQIQCQYKHERNDSMLNATVNQAVGSSMTIVIKCPQMGSLNTNALYNALPYLPSCSLRHSRPIHSHVTLDRST